LEVNNAVVAHLNLEELLHAVSASLQAVVAHDVSGIALYDAANNQLRAHVLGSSDHASAPYFARGVPIPFGGTTGGEAFTTGQPIFVNKPDFARFHSDYSRQIYAAGIRSGGSIPLIAHGRKLGVLGVASQREDAFTADDIDLLCQVAHQIALAVENSLHFESARTAQQHLQRERDHTQLLLEINNAVVSSLDLRELLETVSPCLRQVIHHDFAAVLLYEE
jgi:formate hydrogenlyase transcriptional activator